MAKVKVAVVTEVEENKIKRVKVEDKLIDLYKYEGQIYATSDICSHEHCNIAEGGYMDGPQVECPCHGSRFDVRDGSVKNLPATEPLETFKLIIEGEDVYIDL